MNIFHEVGIPAVKFGLSPLSSPAMVLSPKGARVFGEGVRVNEYVNMAKIYALTAMKMCSQGR